MMNTNEASNFTSQRFSEPTEATTPYTTSQSIPESGAVDSADVTAALNAILAVDKFSASPQMSAFLKYVVEQTLLGHTRRIKAFTVGLEALGKSASFDPQTDPSVRVLAKRLRSSLDTYYQQHPDTPIIIEMKPGSYVPKFLVRGTAQVQHTGTLTTIAVPASNTLTTPATAAAPLTTNSATHVSITQTAKISEDGTRSNSEPSSATATAAETREARESGIQRLWKAYKSAPKIAMLIATMGISGWFGIASMTPALDAQASYQNADTTAEMRLELVSLSLADLATVRPNRSHP